MTDGASEGAATRSLTDLLHAVPVVLEDVETTPMACGRGLKLCRALRPRTRFSAWFERRFGLKRYASFELDGAGQSYFRAIDGKRSLRQIETLLRDEHAFSKEECGAAVVEYTKILMARGLVGLKLPNG